MEGAEGGRGGGRGGRSLARLLVLLPRRLLALGRAVERVLAPWARFGAQGVADVALASRLHSFSTQNCSVASTLNPVQ